MSEPGASFPFTREHAVPEVDATVCYLKNKNPCTKVFEDESVELGNHLDRFHFNISQLHPKGQIGGFKALLHVHYPQEKLGLIRQPNHCDKLDQKKCSLKLHREEAVPCKHSRIKSVFLWTVIKIFPA